MLRNRHQFDMGETHVADIGHQAFGQFIPGGDTSIGMEPRRGMHFVEGQRRVGAVTPCAILHPCRRHARHTA